MWTCRFAAWLHFHEPRVESHMRKAVDIDNDASFNLAVSSTPTWFAVARKRVNAVDANPVRFVRTAVFFAVIYVGLA